MGRANDNATLQFFEVRIRGTGHAASVKGIQVQARSAEAAAMRVAGNGNIVSVRKIKPDDVKFDIEHMDITKTNPPKPDMRQKDTYSPEWTLGQALGFHAKR